MMAWTLFPGFLSSHIPHPLSQDGLPKEADLRMELETAPSVWVEIARS
jgi:hypothetical protein